jgi:integrase
MPVYFDKDKQRWRFTFNRVIKRVRHRATKLLPAAWGRAKAEAYDRTETAKLYAIAAGLEQPEPLIERAVELYVERRLPKLRKKANRPSRITQELAHLAGYIEGRPMSELAEVCHEYAEENPDFAPATIRNRLAYLRAACRYAWRKHKLTAFDPTGQMELPIVDNARDVRLPVETYEAALKKIEDVDTRALFTLAFYTGSRWASEIHPRLPEDVHELRVRGKLKVLLNIGMTKNGAPRLVPVPPKARWALAHLPFPLAARTHWQRMRAVLDELGLEGIVPHDGRHIVATDIILNEGTLADVSVALHHKSLLSSARYVHLLTQHAERVLGGIGARKMHTGRPSNFKGQGR